MRAKLLDSPDCVYVHLLPFFLFFFASRPVTGYHICICFDSILLSHPCQNEPDGYASLYHFVDFYDFTMNDVYTITIAMTAGYHRTEDQNEYCPYK